MTDDSSIRPQIINTDSFAQIMASGEMIIPYGETSFTELKSIYKSIIDPIDGDYNAFLLSGMTMLSDLRGAFMECRKRSKPIYAVIPTDDELLTENELPADAALIVMQSLGAVCFGIECKDEETLIDGITRLKPFARIPLAVKPSDGTLSESAAKALIKAGTDIFTGLTPECAKKVQEIIDSTDPPEPGETLDSLMLANERSAFFLEHDTTEFSGLIECSAGMSEELIEACKGNYDVLRIQLNTPEDVLDFVDNAHMATLPVMFCGDNEIALKHALMLYQGRAMIDSTSLIDPDELKKAARKYGAVIY